MIHQFVNIIVCRKSNGKVVLERECELLPCVSFPYDTIVSALAVLFPLKDFVFDFKFTSYLSKN